MGVRGLTRTHTHTQTPRQGQQSFNLAHLPCSLFPVPCVRLPPPPKPKPKPKFQVQLSKWPFVECCLGFAFGSFTDCSMRLLFFFFFFFPPASRSSRYLASFKGLSCSFSPCPIPFGRCMLRTVQRTNVPLAEYGVRTSSVLRPMIRMINK